MSTQETRAIGWLCSYTPVELIHAAGFRARRITGHLDAPRAADTYMSPNICHFVRSTVDTVVEGAHDDLAGVVFVTSCDAMRRLHDAWRAARPGMTLHVVDLPIEQSGSDASYFAHELGRLRLFLERASGKAITRDDLARAIDGLRRARAAYHALEAARASDPRGVTTADISTTVSSLLSGSVPVESWIAQAVDLLERGKKASTGRAALAGRPRVLLAGCPVHDRGFLDIVEGSGMDVVQENNCTGSAFFDVDVKVNSQASVEGLIDGLASAYLAKPPCARMMQIDERVRVLIEKMHQTRAIGIIHYALKFCDTYQYDVPRLKQHLSAAGIKFLAIEDDCTAGSAGQLRTRLEAFKEILASGG
ncbi:MAG: 2-hydroxyacyl-CoA dehydratase [Candidatus Lokiarchaeota archaeon]|nr:2-hydroxyacyl-CoA dehydratase [Candidatus Lokiarchaeota archaeon]